MTDGTTGIQVAPITEDDMNRVQTILKRAADAIIGMSQLSADVDMLRQTVAGLQADTDRLRNQNNALDEALNYSRSERDRQASELVNVKAELASAHDGAYSLKLENDKLGLVNVQLHGDLDLTRKERDDAQFQVLDLQERLTIAEGKLAKVAELHKALFPETEPAPLKKDPGLAKEWPHSAHAEPVPEPILPVPDLTFPQVDWDKPHHYDNDLGHYVNDPEPDKPSDFNPA